MKKLELRLSVLQVAAKSDDFDVSWNIHLVPSFNEKDVDKYFILCERVALTLKWPKDLQTVCSGWWRVEGLLVLVAVLLRGQIVTTFKGGKSKEVCWLCSWKERLCLIAGVRPLIVSRLELAGKAEKEDVERNVSVMCFYCEKNGAYCAAKVASLVIACDERMNQWCLKKGWVI